jgi:hypothetical protein
MGKLRGQTEAEKFRKGDRLTVKQSIKAQCFICNGEDEGSNEDCLGKSCPLYPWFQKWMCVKRRSGGGHSRQISEA